MYNIILLTVGIHAPQTVMCTAPVPAQAPTADLQANCSIVCTSKKLPSDASVATQGPHSEKP